MKFRKKTSIVDAWQFTKENYKVGVPQQLRCKDIYFWSQYGGRVICGEIVAPDGIIEITEDDWVVKDSNGAFSTCKPDIFEKTYDAIVGTEYI